MSKPVTVTYYPFDIDLQKFAHVENKDIIQRVKQNDQRIIGQLYNEHYNEFIGFFRRKYPSLRIGDAEDIFSECFQIFCGNVFAGKLNTLTSSFKTYLFGIGNNLAHKELLRKGKFSEYEPSFSVNIYELPIDEEPEIKTTILNQTVGQMDEQCKKLLRLFWFEKMSDKDILPQTSYSHVDGVKNQRARCMKRLKKMYLNSLLRESVITKDEYIRHTNN